MSSLAADEEFDQLCFDYGIELDDVVGCGVHVRPQAKLLCPPAPRIPQQSVPDLITRQCSIKLREPHAPAHRCCASTVPGRSRRGTSQIGALAFSGIAAARQMEFYG